MNAVAHAEPVLLSWAEYVKFEEVYEGRRHELVRGRVRLMAGASERHDLTVQAIYDQLRPALRGGPCRVFVRNRKIRTGSDTGYYPDLLVRCGTAADRLFEDDARLIVEVLSPSNDPTDVTERLCLLDACEPAAFEEYGGVRRTDHGRTVIAGLVRRVLAEGDGVVLVAELVPPLREQCAALWSCPSGSTSRSPSVSRSRSA
jgi:hypothetical protein